MIRFLLALGVVASASACGEYPRDTAGTLSRVRGGEMRVGLVEHDSGLDRLVARLAERIRAKPVVRRGAADALLLELEEGRLDLVAGRFDAKTPWSARVTFSKPIATGRASGITIEAKAATRNGEHAWSMEVDRAVAEIAE